MTKTLFTLFILCLSTIAYAQPQLQLDKDTHNFGQMTSRGTTSCVFKLTNSGNDTLQISDIRPECGCTTSDLTKNLLAPGETTDLKVSFSGASAYGPFNKKIVIYTNGNPALKMIYITGTVNNPKGLNYALKGNAQLILNKESLDFDTINNLTLKELSIIVINDSEFEKHLTGFRNKPDWLLSNFTEYTLKPGEEKEIKLKLDAQAVRDFGQIKQYFFILTDDINTPVKMVLLTGFIEPYIETPPKSQRKYAKWIETQPKAEFSRLHINYGDLNSGVKASDTIQLKNTGGDTLKIMKLFSSCGCLQITTDRGEIPPGETAIIHVTFDTVGRKGNQRNLSYIMLNDPLQSKVEITTESQVFR